MSSPPERTEQSPSRAQQLIRNTPSSDNINVRGSKKDKTKSDKKARDNKDMASTNEVCCCFDLIN